MPIDNGSSTDLVNDFGDTTLHEAAAGGHLEIVRNLVNAGASRDAANEEGDTPYDVICAAARFGRCTDFVRESLDELLYDNESPVFSTDEARAMVPKHAMSVLLLVLTTVMSMSLF